MARFLGRDDRRVLSGIDSFASLFDPDLARFKHPVLVLKMEEPGSKQLLAFKHNEIRNICQDTINHLVNDVIVMGAKPLAVLDVIICGKLDRRIVLKIVKGLSEACEKQDCTLVGGETSEQPRVLASGTYVLAASALGVVEREKIIDGSRIIAGDAILALASNGLHTNGFSLIRKLIEERPAISRRKIGKHRFIDEVLRVHRSYKNDLEALFGDNNLHGLAHITGGGIEANLARILPRRVDATIRLDRLRIPPIFKVIREEGDVSDSEMLRVFNMGIGMILVCKNAAKGKFRRHLTSRHCESYPIGDVTRGTGIVRFQEKIRW